MRMLAVLTVIAIAQAGVAALYILGDLVARWRSRRYATLARAWDSQGPRWRWWVLMVALVGLTAVQVAARWLVRA